MLSGVFQLNLVNNHIGRLAIENTSGLFHHKIEFSLLLRTFMVVLDRNLDNPIEILVVFLDINAFVKKAPRRGVHPMVMI